jgi:hypothetical protein
MSSYHMKHNVDVTDAERGYCSDCEEWFEL